MKIRNERNNVLKSFFHALTIAAILSGSLGPAGQAYAGGAVVTIIGDIDNANRGALDPFMDVFLKFNDRSFDKAFAMSKEALDELPQTSVRSNAEGWPMVVEASGPRVQDILAAAGIEEGKRVSFVALDGYSVSLSLEEISSQNWILATSANGKDLDIGGRGPTWLLYDTGDTIASSDEEAKWVWSVYLIVAE